MTNKGVSNDKDWSWDETTPSALDYQGKAPRPEQKDITPKDLLDFAKVCLFWCMIVFCLAGILRGYSNDYAQFFEKSSTVIPPIITLILGFYFGKKSS